MGLFLSVRQSSGPIGRTRCNPRGVLILILICVALAQAIPSLGVAQSFPSTAQDQPASMPWWDNYPLVVGAENVFVLEERNGSVASGGFAVDPSWGIYIQSGGNNSSQMASFHQAGYKCISYYETFGTATIFALELGERGTLDAAPIYRTHWSWALAPDKGGLIRWAGPQNFFDVQDFAGIYTRLHPRYGGRAMTYPNGTVATGYLSTFPGIGGDPTTDPRNSRVLDAGCSKNILGGWTNDISIEFEINQAVNKIDPQTGQPAGPLRGLIKLPDGRYISHISIGKDSACPFWIDFQHSSILMGADRGLDGIWTDNFGPWDSFKYWSVHSAFGEWSVAGFRDYLAKNFSASALQAMGVSNTATFDVRIDLRNKCKALGGDDANLGDWHWTAASWVDDPIWRAYKIYKRQTGTQALTNFYDTTKQAAAQAGKPDFFIEGNDIPLFNLGWARGNLDMVSTEMSPNWSLAAGERGIMLPPAGRFAPVYKLARESAKSRLANIWMYLSGATEAYRTNPGITQVLSYEMLANHALPLFDPNNPNFMGAIWTGADVYEFIKSCRSTFGLRMPVMDIGLYNSSSSILASMTLSGCVDMNKQPHQFAYFGWGTALGELHYQYRAIPDWKLSSDILKNLRVLIIPNSDVLDPSEVTNIIDPWVRAGGLLIVTGDSGYRKGETGNFDPNPSGLSLAGLTGVSSMSGAPARQLQSVGAGKVLFIRDNIGMTFFNYSTQALRSAYLAPFKQAMDDILEGQPPVVLMTDASETVDVNLFEDVRARRLFIDANNLNITLASDVVPLTPTITVTLQLPEWLNGVKRDQMRLSVLSPTGKPSAKMTLLEGNRAEITLDPFKYYASVVIEYINCTGPFTEYM